MMDELMNTCVGSDIIEQAINIKNLEKEALPIRYRLIALGFLKQDTLEDLNDSLVNHGCQPLYSRSSFEATLIYAFANQLSYQEWQEIAQKCETYRIQWQEKMKPHEKNFFHEKYITFGQLERYVLAYSEQHSSGLITRQFTRCLEQEICSLGKNYAEFIRFYSSNLQEFSDVREKSRYYFCKYLYYYLLSKIERYKAAVGNRVPDQKQLIGLLPIKAESTLRRRKTNPEHLMDILRKCAISPAAIFEEFNYYYFEYVSLDWVELMLENINDIEELNDSQMEMIANYLKNNTLKKDLEKIKDYSNKRLIEEYIHFLQSDTREKTSSRKGENAIRKYLRGDLDIDRTTLICFLLFWGSDEKNRNEIKISEKRINTILDECGFSMLRKKEPFDHFVIEYMKSSDPVSYLMKEMDCYLNRGETFFVYEVYANSSSNAKEIRKQMSAKLF